jgi:hypothetical protein
MESSFEPRVLICCECREEFVFTAAAQQYFAEKGYNEDPKRCKSCHMSHKRHQRDHQVVHQGADSDDAYFSR